MTTKVPYWKIGKTDSIDTGFTHADVSAHLLADWAPMLPTSAGAAFMGWPVFLTESFPSNQVEYLSLKQDTGRTERQWKMVLSWMLGVAGTRHVLADEGYKWVAPLSAFYPSNVQQVDLTNWNPVFPTSRVSISRKPRSKSLLPDYVALRTMSGAKHEWAIVESKGTSSNLANMQCPAAWRRQVDSAMVKVDGVEVKVPRRIVAATRSNPNAKKSATRRVQIRAWNSADDTLPSLPSGAAVDIVAASLFGLCCGLELRENAKAIALAVQDRARRAQVEKGGNTETDPRLFAQNATADAELTETLNSRKHANEKWSVGRKHRDSELGRVDIEVQSATVGLIREIRTVPDDAGLIKAIAAAETELAPWRNTREQRRVEASGMDVADIPIGVEVRSMKRNVR